MKKSFGRPFLWALVALTAPDPASAQALPAPPLPPPAAPAWWAAGSGRWGGALMTTVPFLMVLADAEVHERFETEIRGIQESLRKEIFDLLNDYRKTREAGGAGAEPGREEAAGRLLAEMERLCGAGGLWRRWRSGVSCGWAADPGVEEPDGRSELRRLLRSILRGEQDRYLWRFRRGRREALLPGFGWTSASEKSLWEALLAWREEGSDGQTRPPLRPEEIRASAGRGGGNEGAERGSGEPDRDSTADLPEATAGAARGAEELLRVYPWLAPFRGTLEEFAWEELDYSRELGAVPAPETKGIFWLGKWESTAEQAAARLRLLIMPESIDLLHTGASGTEIERLRFLAVLELAARRAAALTGDPGLRGFATHTRQSELPAPFLISVRFDGHDFRAIVYVGELLRIAENPPAGAIEKAVGALRERYRELPKDRSVRVPIPWLPVAGLLPEALGEAASAPASYPRLEPVEFIARDYPAIAPWAERLAALKLGWYRAEGAAAWKAEKSTALGLLRVALSAGRDPEVGVSGGGAAGPGRRNVVSALRHAVEEVRRQADPAFRAKLHYHRRVDSELMAHRHEWRVEGFSLDERLLLFLEALIARADLFALPAAPPS